jgi:hypothetical protein
MTMSLLCWTKGQYRIPARRSSFTLPLNDSSTEHADDTHRRALAINLDASTYGVFAEIGAGQEVAGWFFHVGGAAGTVAKTISAYDMAVSDAIYGKGERYVSRERLVAMLDKEFPLLLERMSPERAAKQRFFVFADTVSARNYAGTNEAHGWLGIRFQHEPHAPPSNVLLHVNMRDRSNLSQQQALGILGVNLIYTAFNRGDTPQASLQSLFAGLSMERLELDVAELNGPGFSHTLNARQAGLKLVRGNFASAVLFSAESGELVQPSDLLRKRPVVLERGAFSTPQSVAAIDLSPAARMLTEEAEGGGKKLERQPISICEMSTHPLRGETPDDEEFSRRIDALRARGLPVMVTSYSESYRLTEYLRRHTSEPLRFAIGASTVVELLRATHYENLIGGLLEALGKLFADNVRIYVRSMPAEVFRQRLARVGLNAADFCTPGQDPITTADLRFPPPVAHLYRYLIEQRFLLPFGA